MIRILRKAAIAAALLLAMGDVWALGLGQIEVKSRRNQPLVAEIPIISTTPGELEALQARLASPETFRRVGLSPPTGVAADLQFSLGSDARGRPVIRVTSIQPVDQASLNFLIEVDWGQGRLVREYSALVDAPNTAGAPVQPAIEAPVAPAPNVVQRPVEVPTTPAPQPAPPPAAPAMPPPAATEPPPQVSAVPLPAPAAPPAAPAMPAAAAGAPRQYGPVKQGETLSKIAGGLGLGAYSLDQNMLALLRANPDAFLADDVNRLRQGAILRVPASAEVQQVSADEAAQVVREQMQQWRQARRAVRQPDVAATAEPAPVAATPASDTAKPSVADVPKPAKPARPAPAQPKPVATRGTGEARLQIIPPSAPGRANGTRSGTAAGGEGSMLQQQLRQKDEEIATKSAEIGDLKERVAELEKLQQEQQSLLSLKDSELAAAQQRLAASSKAAAAAAATPAATSAPKPAVRAEQPVATQPQAGTHASTAWLWGGIGIVVLAGLAWLFTRRRKDGMAAPAPRRPSFDSEALAASMTPPLLDEGSEPAVGGSDDIDDIDDIDDVDDVDDGAAVISPATATIDLTSVPPQAARTEAPTWHSGWVKSDAPAPAAAPAAEPPKPRFLPDEEQPRQPPRAAAPQASVEQRFKLAHAFMDIGDDHSARQLLLELMDDKDPAARTEAARLLRELG